jgi:hypothetical protein
VGDPLLLCIGTRGSHDELAGAPARQQLGQGGHVVVVDKHLDGPLLFDKTRELLHVLVQNLRTTNIINK